MIELSSLSEGMELPCLEKLITQEHVNLYAEASRDFNPIHTDEDFAKKTPLGGTIAHGMLVLAYISQMMTNSFGRNWLIGGKLNVRFKTPARPKDTITISGKIMKVVVIESQKLVKCDVLCSNQNGEAIITGDATVMFSGENSG